MTNENETPCLAENYSTAVTASNLRVDVKRNNIADILIASGMSKSRMGGALMRLRTEYGGDSVPRKTASTTDHVMLMGKLKSLTSVLDQMIWQARKWELERPEAVSLAIVAHWLDENCKTCEGRGKEKIKNTPSLSNRFCNHCNGTGHTRLPHGLEGRRMREYIDSCVSDWHGGTRAALRR